MSLLIIIDDVSITLHTIAKKNIAFPLIYMSFNGKMTFYTIVFFLPIKEEISRGDLKFY